MKRTLKLSLLSIILVVGLLAKAQTLQHPVIYTTSAERQTILNKISANTWASSLRTAMKNVVDPKITTHTSNKNTIFANVLTFPTDDENSESSASPYASAHSEVLLTAEYSAIMYYITLDTKYAAFAADILAYYFDVLSTRVLATTTITGNDFYDTRTTYHHLAVAYDFIYDYLKTSGRQVYNKATGTMVAYDHIKAQTVITNIAKRSLNEAGGADKWGSIVSNHPVLQAPGSIFPIFCVEDDTERERLFKIFWETGTKRQNSFTKTILKMYTEQALWPEAVSYGFMPNTQLVINLVDRIKPELNAGANNLELFKSAALLENLRLPNRYFVRYGDSHRKNDGTGNINRYALNFAKRRGYTDIQTQTEIALLQSFPTSKGYSTTVPTKGFDNYTSMELFWGEPIASTAATKFDYKPTVVIRHAGVALQRNYVDANNTDYGLCGIIGGAHYVHAHLTGITMELYGGGDVMAPNGGLPPSLAERSTLPFQGYFNRYAGNNTVIVNGTSHGKSFTGAWGNDKLLYQDTTKNIAAEPKHLQAPLSKSFSFATQFLDDNVNNCDQQRTLSTIRTSQTTAYYFDVFRSKSNGTNSFHDYMYHNIGDATTLTDANNTVIPVAATTKYTTYYNDAYKSPGWVHFEQTNSSAATSAAVKVRFDLNTTQRYMHMFVPGGISREYTKALGAATYEALNGYEDKKTQIIAIRQQGEAWNKPYICVFEPSLSTASSVKSVDNLMDGDKIVGAKVVSHVNDSVFTDYIISQESATSVYTNTSLNISFEGRFAIIRTKVSPTKSDLTLYIGEGKNLSFASETLVADATNKGLKVVPYVPNSVADVYASKLAFKLFPNPTKNSFVIDTKGVENPKISIFDIAGKKVFEKNSSDDLIPINTKELSLKEGVYIVELLDKSQNKAIQKLIIK